MSERLTLTILLVFMHIAWMDGCFFRDCSNMDWYRKRALEGTFSRQKVFRALPGYLQSQPFQCTREDAKDSSCKFNGNRVCCQQNDNDGVACQVTSTNKQQQFLSSGVLKRVERIMHEFVELSDRDMEPQRKYCISIGVCCNWERCRPEVSCSYKEKQNFVPNTVENEIYQDQTGLVSRIANLLDDMY
uniref:Uncharacterized protein n=1 Tax=Ciona savignyi TaxID=51511 RepID=H2YIB8_CIOSA